jgi:hypothetical protein
MIDEALIAILQAKSMPDSAGLSAQLRLLEFRSHSLSIFLGNDSE